MPENGACVYVNNLLTYLKKENQNGVRKMTIIRTISASEDGQFITKKTKDALRDTNSMIFDHEELRHADGLLLTSVWSNRPGDFKNPERRSRYATAPAEIHEFIDGEFTVYINNEEIGTYDSVVRAAKEIECRVASHI